MVSPYQLRLKRAKELFESNEYTDLQIAEELDVTLTTVQNYKKKLDFVGKSNKPKGIIDQIKEALTGMGLSFLAVEVLNDEDLISGIGNKFKKIIIANPELSTFVSLMPFVWRQKIRPFLEKEENTIIVDGLSKLYPYVKLLGIPGAIMFVGLWIGRKLSSRFGEAFDWVRPFFMAFIEFFTSIADIFGVAMERAKELLDEIQDKIPGVDVPEFVEGAVVGEGRNVDPRKAHPWLTSLLAGGLSRL